MRVQVLIICFLASLLGWGIFYGMAKNGYHLGQGLGVFPNLQIKERIRSLWKDDDVSYRLEVPDLPLNQSSIAS